MPGTVRQQQAAFAVLAALAAFVAALSLLSSPQAAFAVTVTWTGATNGNWATGTNWDTGVAPVTGDDVVLTDAANDPTNNDLVGVQLRSVTINSMPDSAAIGGNAIELQNGGFITNNAAPAGSGTTINTGVTLNGPAPSPSPRARHRSHSTQIPSPAPAR